MIVWLLAAGCVPSAAQEVPDRRRSNVPRVGQVVKVYDGDTFTLASGDRVRLRSVNTPELRPLEPFGKAARDHATRGILHASVTLEVGPGPSRDAYDRIIARVQGPRGDLAETLVTHGYAHVFVIPPEAPEVPRLLHLEAEAREQALGIWSLDSLQHGLRITSFHANAPGDDRDNVNGEYLRLCNVSGEVLDLSGYQLFDRAGRTHSLPSLSIPPGHTVRIHSGPGRHQTDPSDTLAVHLGSEVPLWNNTDETVTLRGPKGQLVDRRHHKGRAR